MDKKNLIIKLFKSLRGELLNCDIMKQNAHGSIPKTKTKIMEFK